MHAFREDCGRPTEPVHRLGIYCQGWASAACPCPPTFCTSLHPFGSCIPFVVLTGSIPTAFPVLIVFCIVTPRCTAGKFDAEPNRLLPIGSRLENKRKPQV